MKCKNCNRVLDFLDANGKGVCVGLIKKPLKKLPEDLVVLCFIKSKLKDKYLLKHSEGLAIASGLAGAFEVYIRKTKIVEETK